MKEFANLPEEFAPRLPFVNVAEAYINCFSEPWSVYRSCRWAGRSFTGENGFASHRKKTSQVVGGQAYDITTCEVHCRTLKEILYVDGLTGLSSRNYPFNQILTVILKDLDLGQAVAS